jgi:hypothetical protein
VKSKIFVLKNVPGLQWKGGSYAHDSWLSAYTVANYGRVVVHNYLYPVHRMYEPGGLGKDRRPLLEPLLEEIIKEFPGLVDKAKGANSALRFLLTNQKSIERWLDAKGNVLYVGKAKNLKNRMQTYVQNGEKRSAWTEIMVRQIDNFEVTVVRSELEALLLETNLIKKLRPKYNILMKDDKGYVYVRVSLFEPYPRVDVVRRLENDKARTFGPFMGARNTEQALMMLDSILHFRACKKSLDQLNHQPEPQDVDHAPCLDHQIGKCNGRSVVTYWNTDWKELGKRILLVLFLSGLGGCAAAL